MDNFEEIGISAMFNLSTKVQMYIKWYIDKSYYFELKQNMLSKGIRFIIEKHIRHKYVLPCR